MICDLKKNKKNKKKQKKRTEFVIIYHTFHFNIII